MHGDTCVLWPLQNLVWQLIFCSWVAVWNPYNLKRTPRSFPPLFWGMRNSFFSVSGQNSSSHNPSVQCSVSPMETTVEDLPPPPILWTTLTLTTSDSLVASLCLPWSPVTTPAWFYSVSIKDALASPTWSGLFQVHVPFRLSPFSVLILFFTFWTLWVWSDWGRSRWIYLVDIWICESEAWKAT